MVISAQRHYIKEVFKVSLPDLEDLDTSADFFENYADQKALLQMMKVMKKMEQWSSELKPVETMAVLFMGLVRQAKTEMFHISDNKIDLEKMLEEISNEISFDPSEWSESEDEVDPDTLRSEIDAGREGFHKKFKDKKEWNLEDQYEWSSQPVNSIASYVWDENGIGKSVRVYPNSFSLDYDYEIDAPTSATFRANAFEVSV